ncbi:GDSL esterase/lipase At3g14820-like [Abrus precatorius]|uniref:GDSL esterase/lipase At3g14820-like n=1 Tax=Abrus precatorius TaxID=3816 RepID=A0A8B8KVJ6_ABRPR|nr:GDSL esterase/lipase At3g14820-like [Abrus precatorius]
MMKLFTLNFLYICPLLVLFYPIDATAMSQSNKINFTIPAVIVFGDSIMDTGNNNYIPTLLKANFPPYGRDFFGGKATGRFSNGKIPSDFYAEIFKLKDALPPYRDPNLKTEDLLTGVSFASAGSGCDPLTVRLASALSINDQLNMFKEYIEKLKKAVGEEKTAFIIRESLYMISTGSNDVAVTYFLTPFRRNIDIQEYTSNLVKVSSDFIQELYQLGARRIGMLSLTPLGCVPIHRTLLGGSQRNCADLVNDAAMMYNSKLSSSIMDLKKSLPEAKLVNLEIYSIMDNIIRNHNQFGFDVEGSSCCGLANIETGLLCNSLTLKVCPDASKYVFWDGYHPSEKTYNIVISKTMENNMHKFN